MEDHSQPDLFSPLVNSEALMGPFLFTARLFTTGIFAFYIFKELTKIDAPGAFIYLTIAAQGIGILLIALGYKTRLASLLMFVCILGSLIFRGELGLHNFWSTISEKDVAIAGGFLFMFAYGPGRWSVDSLRGDDSPFFAPLLSNESRMGMLLLLGRIMGVFVFFFFGISKILHTPEIKAYMVRHNAHIPTNLVYLAILTQIVPPLLVLLGYKTRYGALALAGFCLIATSLFHSDFANPGEVEHFLLDFAIAGVYLFMFVNGPGSLSFDAAKGRARPAGAKQPLSVGA
jgi:putative oxidoreductase